MPDRVALYLDYQNVLLTGRDRFARGLDWYKCVPEPTIIADKIQAMRADSRVVTINVYRGRPDPRNEPVTASANDRQANAWSKDRRVTMTRRPLTYRGWPHHPPIEKGIDVQLASHLIRDAVRQAYDAQIVFSSDSDPQPAIEVACEVGSVVEVACWDGCSRLDSTPDIYYKLSRADWRKMIRDWTGRA